MDAHMELVFRTTSELGTVELGEAIGRVLREGDVVALEGELGAGKTRLVRGMAVGMGLDPGQVSSPTYVLVHEYTTPAELGDFSGLDGGALVTPMMHVDAYRLSGSADVSSLGWERVVDGLSVVVIEWASRIWEAIAQEPSLGRVRMVSVASESNERATGDGEQIESEEGSREIRLIAPAGWRLRAGWTELMAKSETDGLRGSEKASAAGAISRGTGRCPACGSGVVSGAMTEPFCTDRCRMADLGRWFSGAYVVSRELREDDDVQE